MTSDAGGAPRQDAAGPSPEEIEEALDALHAVWGDEYVFGYEPGTGWQASPAGQVGSLLTAGSPRELGELLAAREGAQR